MFMMICFTTSVGALRLLDSSQLLNTSSLRAADKERCLAARFDSLNQSLVNAKLICVPGLASLTARRLPSGDLQGLGRQADGPLDSQILGFGALDQLLADFFERLHFA